MNPDVAYSSLLGTAAGLAQLVVIAFLLERVLAFVFEYHWMKALTDRYNGIKGPLALGLAWLVCYLYNFDVLAMLFAPRDAEPVPTQLGVVITAGIVAGGSAGAISLFQGVLNFGKESRDKLISAKKLKASAQEDVAEAEALRARAALEDTRKSLGLTAEPSKEERRVGKTVLTYDRRRELSPEQRVGTPRPGAPSES